MGEGLRQFLVQLVESCREVPRVELGALEEATTFGVCGVLVERDDVGVELSEEG